MEAELSETKTRIKPKQLHLLFHNVDCSIIHNNKVSAYINI